MTITRLAKEPRRPGAVIQDGGVWPADPACKAAIAGVAALPPAPGSAP
jgi:hypothetical protein